MATAQATILTENEQLASINADYEQRYGFHDAEHYLYKRPRGSTGRSFRRSRSSSPSHSGCATSD